MTEKEAVFLEQDIEAASSLGMKDISGLPPCSQTTGKETIDRWSAGFDAKPLNSDVADFVPAQNICQKFVTGEVYALNERVAGWSCEAIMEIELERYGDPAAFAAACIENSTIGPKLSNRDYT